MLVTLPQLSKAVHNFVLVHFLHGQNLKLSQLLETRIFPGSSIGKESAWNAGDPGQYLGREDPLKKEMAAHFSILAWKIYGQRSLVGYSPWGHKESDTT